MDYFVALKYRNLASLLTMKVGVQYLLAKKHVNEGNRYCDHQLRICVTWLMLLNHVYQYLF